uniref:AAA+ ATPase domain-containing protein n=2 Tax=Aplanochytrium stocchinoi TaxID=215587 RepID=A0A7S3PKW1_9STRA|mmetsp:Transcript_2781/g.3751  ORF Transcript_2781/g.3751 Transcript_2781/m.3751 type:complete len:604 (+) Transcript_2781:244-2055(+)
MKGSFLIRISKKRMVGVPASCATAIARRRPFNLQKGVGMQKQHFILYSSSNTVLDYLKSTSSFRRDNIHKSLAVVGRSRETIGNETYNPGRIALLAFVFALSGMISQDSACCETAKGTKGDSGSDFDVSEELKAKLDSARRKLREAYKIPHYVRDRKVSISKSPEGTTCISFKLHRFSGPLESVTTLVNNLAKENSLKVVKQTESGTRLQDEEKAKDMDNSAYTLALAYEDGTGSVLLKAPNYRTEEWGELMFFKDGAVTSNEVDSIVRAYETSVGMSITSRSHAGVARGPFLPTDQLPHANRDTDTGSSHEKLMQLGARVYLPNSTKNDEGMNWNCLAGYENVKRDVEDTILLAVKHPEMYTQIAKATRDRFEMNKPRAVLFEGPPGCGKTTCARIISSIADMPMVYIPVEAIMSKYYGESENRLSEIFKLCEDLGPCIIFLDEIDSLATTRSTSNMHEATRRILSVLLRTLDGFEDKGEKRSVLVAATNRKKDLDPALISRFSLSVHFELPDVKTRAAIFKCYAKQLSEKDRLSLAQQAIHFSGRDIKDVCELAERRWASKRIRKTESALNSVTPTLEEYHLAIKDRLLGFEPYESNNMEY